MYPKNNASPPRIAIGAVILIADGTVQSSGVSVVVRAEGGAESAGGGTISYGASSNVVYYTPTQAETNYTAFVVTAYKASCLPVSQTVITSASSTPGEVNVTGHTPQTADHTAAIAAVKAETVLIVEDTNELQTDDIPATLATLATATALATAQDDLDTITGADGVALASTQQSITFQPITITAANGVDNITLAGSGTSDGLAFTRSGSGGLFGANWAAAIEAEVTDALTAYAPATEAKQDATDIVITELTAQGDTNETKLDTVAGYLDTEIGTLLTNLSAVLALLDDPRAEPGQGTPPVNADLATKIDYLYKNWRNLKDQSATGFNLYNDAGSTVDQKATVSEAAGVVTKTEIVTGP